MKIIMEILFINDTDTNLKDFMKENRSFSQLFGFAPQVYRNVLLNRDILPAAVLHPLLRAKCTTIGKLLTYSPKMLLNLRDIGVGRFIITVNALWEYCMNNKGNQYFINDSQQFLTKEFEALKKILSANIKNIRKRRCQSQSEFADSCDISLESLQDIENCIFDPNLSILHKISFCFGCTVSDLLAPNKLR